MAYETKPQTGALFANTDKKHPKAPDYQGDLVVDPKQMKLENNGLMKIKLGGWKTKSETTGKTYLSLRVDTWEPTQQSVQPSQNYSQVENDDDDVPF